MKFYADLHIHSHYSRATSRELCPEFLEAWAQLKGIGVVGTGDFVHPGWLAELEEKLEPAGDGLFHLRKSFGCVADGLVPPACRSDVRFMLTAEIANIYKRGERVRKVHNVVCVPGFDAARRVQGRLDAIGNIRSDGRPILGLDSRDLLEIVLESDPRSFLIPAHIWTPWFSVLGSKSGFDTVAECYADLAGHIFAVETGLSSDPPMNWRLSSLDPYVLVSHSDAHSPAKLGRECNLFDTELTYGHILRALQSHDDRGLLGTVEFFPEEGKYHFDGHRKCDSRLHPRETIGNKGLCPVCGKKVTVGVMARVEALADRPEGAKGERWREYHSLVPLAEVIAEARGVGSASRQVQAAWRSMVERLGGELRILAAVPLDRIEAVAGSLVAEGIRRVRAGEVSIAAGYDGEFGTIQLFDDKERSRLRGQVSLFAPEEAGSVRETGPGRTTESTATDVTEHSMVGDETLPLFAEESAADQAESGRDDAGDRKPALLNDAQWRAVCHEGSHLIIVAGPGTGKTHTLTHRIARVAARTPAGRRLLAVTFTNRAAGEMRERIAQRCGELAQRVFVGTFHTFCLDLLREHESEAGVPGGVTIADEAAQGKVLERVWTGESAGSRRDIAARISLWKGSALLGSDVPEEVRAYDAALRAEGMLDFDDLLRDGLRLLVGNDMVRTRVHETCRRVFVDEYQDINAIQHELLRAVVGPESTVTAIGDPDQAIYGFRGADVGLFERFSQSFPGAVTLHLTDNYRSAGSLLAASGQVIAAGPDSSGHSLRARFIRKGRLTVHEAPTEKAEAEFVVHQVERLVGGTGMFSHDSGRADFHGEAERGFGEIAVLCRLNAQRKALEEAFERSGIPYQVSGDLPLSRAPLVAELLTLLRLADGQIVEPSLAGDLLEAAVEGIGPDTRKKLEREWEERNTRVSVEVLRSLAQRESSTLKAAIRSNLSTLLAEMGRLGLAIGEKGPSEALELIPRLASFRARFASDSRAEDRRRALSRAAATCETLGRFLDRVRLLRPDDSGLEGVEKVSIMTLHAAKGLEFPVVFIVGCDEGLLPLSLEGLRSDPEEERRLFYVGMTRAREELFLVRALKRFLFGRSLSGKASPYLADIAEELKAYERARHRRTDEKPEAEQLSLFG